MYAWSLLHRLSDLDIIFVIFERQTFHRVEKTGNYVTVEESDRK